MNFIKKCAKVATQSIQTYTPAIKGQKTKSKPIATAYLDPNQSIKLAIVRGQSSMNNLASTHKVRIKECFNL